MDAGWSMHQPAPIVFQLSSRAITTLQSDGLTFAFAIRRTPKTCVAGGRARSDFAHQMRIVDAGASPRQQNTLPLTQSFHISDIVHICSATDVV
jgi:hypothetical protein